MSEGGVIELAEDVAVETGIVGRVKKVVGTTSCDHER